MHDYINKNNIDYIDFLDSQLPEDLSNIYSSSDYYSWQVTMRDYPEY